MEAETAGPLANLDDKKRDAINVYTRLEVAKRAAINKDILLWGRMMFPDKFPIPFCQEMHGYFVEIRKNEFTNTEAPRGHAKTTIRCFLLPIFQALEEPWEFRHYLNVQATDIKALTVNRTIKCEFESNEALIRLYGNMIGERWTDQQFVLTNGVVFTAVSTGQSIRGINYRSERPSFIIVDDLYNTEEDGNNPESTKKKNDWFWSTLYPARARGKKCSIHVQGTAINKEDLLNELKGKERWTSRTFQAITDWGNKVVLWPELNTYESLEDDKKDMGSLIFYREMQNERWDDSTSIIKRSWLEKWEYDPAQLIIDGKYRRLVGVFLLCDPSIGKNLENDDTAIGVMWKTITTDSKAMEYWIDYATAEHLSLNERVLKLQSVADRCPENRRVSKAILEAVGGFQDFGAEAKRRTNLPITTVEKVKDKISNLMTKSVHFESGRVHLNKNIPMAIKDKIVYQLTTNYPKNDDLRDMILLGLDSSTLTMWDRL